MKKDIVFNCRKCGHLLFIDKTFKGLGKLLKTDCPECGEEAHKNWIIERFGDYEKEYGEYDTTTQGRR